MRYFRLIDDIQIPERWHLGEIAGGAPVELGGSARVVAGKQRLSVNVTHGSRPLDFSLTSFGVPVVTTALGIATSEICGSDAELLPITVSGSSGYRVLNATRLLSSLDERRSEYIKWTSADYRSDLAGHYRMVTKLRLDKSKIPATTHLFRIEGWPIALVASDELRRAMLSVGCHGAKFLEVD